MNNIRNYQCVSASIIFSTLFNLLRSNKALARPLFFFLPIILKNILTIPLLIRNTKIIVPLAIATGVPMTVLNEKKEIPLPEPYKKTKALVYLVFCSSFLLLTLTKKKSISLILISLNCKGLSN